MFKYRIDTRYGIIYRSHRRDDNSLSVLFFDGSWSTPCKDTTNIINRPYMEHINPFIVKSFEGIGYNTKHFKKIKTTIE